MFYMKSSFYFCIYERLDLSRFLWCHDKNKNVLIKKLGTSLLKRNKMINISRDINIYNVLRRITVM